MLPPPPDTRNPARLATLEGYGILDTPPEPAFDDIVLIAKELCNTPIALVSLVTADRQWFKAKVGIEAQETPVEQAVCAHAIANGRTLVIPDLTQDERTNGNPLVTGDPHLRFYAGALLEAPNGEVMGTLCVIDTASRPQSLSAAKTTALEALARQVVHALEMRKVVQTRETALVNEHLSRRASDTRAFASEARASASEARGQELRDAAERAMAAQTAARVGTFEIDLTTDVFRCTPETCRIFGIPDAPEHPTSRFEQLVIPEDRATASNTEARRSGAVSPVTEYRIRRASDNAVRWLSRRGDYVLDSAGKRIAFTGAIQDITERKLSEIRQAALIGLGDQIRDATTPMEIVKAAARTAGETLAASRAGYSQVDLASDTLRILDDWAASGVESLKGVSSLQPFQETITRLQRGEPLVVANIPKAEWLGQDLPSYELIATKAQITVPLLARGHLVGLFYVHATAPRTWTADEVAFAHAISDRVYATLAKAEAENQQRQLNDELSHRLKNTLALVQAIATQTLKNVADQEALQTFRQRLTALSKAHDMLLQQSWSAARIRSVIDAVTPVHIDRGRVDLLGPDLLLAPRAVLSLSMLLHELATNAVKHGSLSWEKGKVSLRWRVDYASPEPMIVLTWDEIGGPPALEPQKQGMGSRLIKAGLAGTGDSIVRYQSSGLSAEFRAPLSLVTGP